jgi:ribonuclease P protein subunit POP4
VPLKIRADPENFDVLLRASTRSFERTKEGRNRERRCSMEFDKNNFMTRELIGLHAKVVESTNADSVGITGRIIDETRNTLTIDTIGREKKLIKHGNTFDLTLSDNDTVRIAGDLIVGRPEDRVAKMLRKRHNR